MPFNKDGTRKTMDYSKSSGFKMKGWSPFTKVAESMTSKKNPDANEKKPVNKKINNIREIKGTTIFGKTIPEIKRGVKKGLMWSIGK